MNYKAVFVDRDGTINVDGPYLSDPEKFQMYPGVGKGAKILKDHGFKIIVITNQSGIGRGYFTENDLVKIHEKMRQVFRKYQVDIDGIYYCPHHPNANCECRKPKTKLFEKAMQEHHIDIKKSYMIGDTIQDIEAGKKIGVKTILIPVPNAIEENVIEEKIVLKKIKECKPDYIAINFLKAVDWMLHNDKTN